MIDEARTADILRLHFVEKWPVGTIASQLHLHHDTVERVLSHAGLGPARHVRARLIDPYLPFVHDTLTAFPTLPASRLFAMVQERGYPGAPDAFRKIVACYRPRPYVEAFVRRRTLPGEEAQVDWAHFGSLSIGRARRTLYAFVMVLSFSRAVFLRFGLSSAMAAFLRGHVLGFQHFGGVARRLLFDNLKSLVLERQGDAIRYHPCALALAKHYHFEPVPCAPRRGNEKGRVERAIRYVRDNFFAARSFSDLDDLNAQALAWCLGPACERRVPDEPSLRVGEALEQERPRLVPLPPTPFEQDERKAVHIGKTPYARFDLNDYSVPSTHVRRTLVVAASEHRVRVLDGTETIADHARCYDRDVRIDNPAHLGELLERKRKARSGQGFERLYHAVPSSRVLMHRLAEQGGNLGAMTSALLGLLAITGNEALERAVAEAVRLGRTEPRAIRHLLDQDRRARGAPMPSSVPITRDPRLVASVVRPHSLDAYNALVPKGSDHDPR